MYSDVMVKSGDCQGDIVDIWNWKVSLVFFDLGKEGNVGVVLVGQFFYVFFISNNNNVFDIIFVIIDVFWFVEIFYLY